MTLGKKSSRNPEDTHTTHPTENSILKSKLLCSSLCLRAEEMARSQITWIQLSTGQDVPIIPFDFCKAKSHPLGGPAASSASGPCSETRFCKSNSAGQNNCPGLTSAFLTHRLLWFPIQRNDTIRNYQENHAINSTSRERGSFPPYLGPHPSHSGDRGLSSGFLCVSGVPLGGIKDIFHCPFCSFVFFTIASS